MGGRLRDDRSKGSGWTGPAVEFRPHGLKERNIHQSCTINVHTHTVVHVQLFIEKGIINIIVKGPNDFP